MLMRVGLEKNNDSCIIAWALEHPGCFAYGRHAQEARQDMHAAALQVAAWI